MFPKTVWRASLLCLTSYNSDFQGTIEVSIFRKHYNEAKHCLHIVNWVIYDIKLTTKTQYIASRVFPSSPTHFVLNAHVERCKLSNICLRRLVMTVLNS